MPNFETKLLVAILDQSADAIIFADAAGVVQIWNQAAASLFGYSPKEAVGGSMDLIIPEKLRAAHWTGYQRAMETGMTRLKGHPTVTRATHRSGARLYVEMTFAVVQADDGKVLGSVAVARDATERYEQARAQRTSPAT